MDSHELIRVLNIGAANRALGMRGSLQPISDAFLVESVMAAGESYPPCLLI